MRTDARTRADLATEARAGGSHALMIDWTACDGRGMCVELLPELLDSDPWGYPKTRTGGQAAPVPPGTLAVVPAELVPAARQAVTLCPLLALRLQPR